MKRLNGIDARHFGVRVRSCRAMVLALGLIAGAAQATTTIHYTYDAGDHVTSVTDPRGLVTSYVYDGLGQLLQQSSPDTGTTSFSYDSNGRRASMTRANGVLTSYTYDAIGRMTVLSAGGQSQRFTYDSCANGLGRMCTAADANGSVGYSYTREGWISGRAFTVGSTTYTVGYGYNAMGQVVTVVYPDGNQALYSYTNGMVSSVSMNIGGTAKTAASQITYQPQDRALASWVGSNGLTTTLFYDTDGRFTGANVLGVLTYGIYYDNASRIIRKQDFISPILTESFGYDEQSRLVSVQGGAENEAYQYDANGNRIAQTVNGTSMNIIYDSGSNRMIQADKTTFGYDAMGNSVIANGISRWQFDPFNRMTSAFGNTYYIDPLGQRLMKSVSGTNTYFAPDESNHLIAENDAGLWVDYLWLNGRLIARTHGGQMEDIHLDQVGRPEAMTNADQTLAWRVGNTPFSRWMGTNNAVPLNLGFPGQYFDAELNLWNNGYRDYFPWVGRYLESDPIGLAGGINTYAYVGGNPLSYTDPLGLRYVNVYIWHAQGSSVGHVMVTEDNSQQVILSQFPANGMPIGQNETKDFNDTMNAEGRPADSVWRVYVPDDSAFDNSAAHERSLSRWSWDPSKRSTQCSIAASRALQAGGVGLTAITEDTLFPGQFDNNIIKNQSNPGNDIQRLQP